MTAWIERLAAMIPRVAVYSMRRELRAENREGLAG
jgi:hypothetical protein